MHPFYLRREIVTQLSVLKLPVRREENIVLNSRDECEDFLDNVDILWRKISLPIAPVDYINYENQILKCQVRTQNVTQVRMIHRIVDTSRLIVDLTFRFQYRFKPADYNFQDYTLQEYFSSLPKGFVTYPRLVPSGIYAAHYYPLSERNSERCPGGNYATIEPSETFYVTTETEEIRETYKTVI